MESLLYLVHRIPYPPNKGDKIRSYHLLQYLSKHYQIHLGSFIDDNSDWQYLDKVNEYCESSYIAGLNPRWAKIRSLFGFAKNEALTIPYYYNRQMASWVKETIEKYNVTRIVIFSSAMAQYVEHNLSADIASVIDFVDVDSDKWQQYAGHQKWPFNWIYKRESKKLLQYESDISEKFSKNYFVSKVEADLFRNLTNNPAADIDYYNNGVDYDYFDPEAELENPYTEDKVLVFTGAMDYWANVDAITWFANEIFPEILVHIKNVSLYIVGVNPQEQVQRLDNGKNIIVTGKVADIRSYIKYASVVVVPLRVARGVQNKVLEAMAFNKPVVATPAAIEGIEQCDKFLPLISETETGIANHCVKMLEKLARDKDELRSRECITSLYDWDANLAKIQGVIETLLKKPH